MSGDGVTPSSRRAGARGRRARELAVALTLAGAPFAGVPFAGAPFASAPFEAVPFMGGGPLFAQTPHARGSAPPVDPSASARTQTVVAGPRYEAGAIRRWLLGGGHREVWLLPVEVPVLDLWAIGGGLTPVERGGGNQSITLHMLAADGREYVFRSVDKHVNQGFPDDLKDTFVGEQIQDVTSSLYPAGALVVGELLDATGILHVDPVLYVMADDPGLGEFRETFAGMLGTLELTPDEGENGEITFAGSNVIKGTEEFLEDLDSSPRHLLNDRRYLKARLFDLIVNDTDRGADQWRWARFDRGSGFLWEPIPRDRDWTFVHAEGLLLRLAKGMYPKVVPFGPAYPDLRGLTIGGWDLDRRLLAGLDWNVWSEVVGELQRELSDARVQEALLALPEPWRVSSGPRIAEVLAARRDALGDVARAYYDLLSFEVDVRGTEEGERAELERLPGGDARLRLYAAGSSTPHYDRLFLEEETREIRLYLEDGGDELRVHGREDDGAVILRAVGGGGDDVMIDEGGSTDWKVRTAFYDWIGDDRLEGSRSTLVSRTAYERPQVGQGFVEARLQSPPRDWGGGASWSPALGYGDAEGVMIGVNWDRKRYGFRTDHYRYHARVSLSYATRSGRFGGSLSWSNRFTTYPVRFDASVRATQLESFRFFGYGNEAPPPDDVLDVTLIDEDRVEAAAMGVLELGHVELGIGPIFRYTDPRPREGSVLERGPGVSRVGGRVSFAASTRSRRIDEPELPWAAASELEIGVEAFPAAMDLVERMTSVDAEAESRFPIPIGGRPPMLILRAGGRHVWGDAFPVDESAFVGGGSTVRGYRFDRFAGRSSAFGSAELRVALFQLELFTRGRFGVLGFGDVGRVWWDDEESARWHSGRGGGIWWETLGFLASVEIARGEETLYYLGVETPF